MLMISSFYRWIRAAVAIRIGVAAAPGDAPAAEVGGSTTIPVVVKTALRGQPVADGKASGSIVTALFAGLVSYSRAAVVYVSKIWTGVSAKADTAVGTEAAYEEALTLARVSRAGSADAVTTDYTTEVVAELLAAAGSAPADHCGVETAFAEESGATAGTAPVIGANIQIFSAASHGARMATWMEPYIENGILYIRQAYSAEVKNGVLEVR